MITQGKRIKILDTEERTVWLYPTVCLVGVRLNMKEGERHVVYSPIDGDDFLSQGIDYGQAAALRSTTIVPPGSEVIIINEAIEDPIPWVGSSKPVGNGIHVKARVYFEAQKDSVMYCVSPRDNMKGFHDKDVKRVTLKPGEEFVFGDLDIGFVVVYGKEEEHFQSFLVEPGDVYLSEGETVMSVVRRKEVE